MKALHFIKKTLSFDERSLGLFRILLGLLIMSDVIYRWPDLMDFYTDVGLIPRSIFTGEMSMPWSFSFHLANGSYPFIVGMFTIHFIFGLMVFTGYKTRWGIIGAYIMAISVHNRNWLINNGGDDVLRAILFISIFLPFQRRFSVDAAMETGPRQKKEHFSTWGLTFFLQAFVIYFVSYILKNHDIWRTDYTAFFYSSRLDIFATPLGVWLRDFPAFGKFITAFSIYLEWIGPLLLIFAFIFGRFWWVLRTLLVFSFIGFHFGIFLTMNIGLFAFICMAMWTLFLPGPFWDFCGEFYLKRNFDKLTIYFDQECGFCQKSVRILKSFLLLDTVALKAAQSDSVINSEMKKKNSWVVVNEKGDHFFRYDAWVELMKHSPAGCLIVPVFSLKVMRILGDKVYELVSKNRPHLSKVSQFLDYRSPRSEIKVLSWAYQLSGAFIFATLLMWNLTTIKKYEIKAPFFQDVTRWIHIYQEWNMFAPFPKMDNIWVEIPAVLSDGTQIELLSGSRDIYSIKSDVFNKSIPNEHWRKFFLNLSDRADYARYYGGFLCRRWNDRDVRLVKDVGLRKFEIIVYSQLNLDNGEKGGIVRKLSWKHWCFDEDFKNESKGSNSDSAKK